MQTDPRMSHRGVVATMAMSSGLHVPAQASARTPGAIQGDADRFLHKSGKP
jgi:hypothetical protein